MKLKCAKSRRRGYVAPLVALLMIPLMAMMAFSIDIGYEVEVRAELVNTSDAAVLAGVQQLYGPYQQWQTATGSSKTTIYNNAITDAKATAVAVANLNRAGSVYVQLVPADVDVGYTDANGTYYSGNASKIPANTFPNTVKVTARRDNTSLPQSNGELPLFFGSAVGKASFPLTASATAIAYEGSATNFKSLTNSAGLPSGIPNALSSSGVNSSMLPVADDMTQWTDFYKNGVNSQYADPNAPSGTAWLQIYPGGTGDSMDGLLSLNGTKAASNTYYSGGPPSGGWIQCGPTPLDVTSLHALGQLPLPSSGKGATWASGPGMKSDLLSDFQALVTNPPTLRMLPLFDPNALGTTGGGNGTYQICYFVPVYVVYADGHGKANMDIAVVPATGHPITDVTAVVGNVSPLGTSGVPPQYTVPVPAKVTQ
jgi:Flp pilus assembly protein TadG